MRDAKEKQQRGAAQLTRRCFLRISGLALAGAAEACSEYPALSDGGIDGGTDREDGGVEARDATGDAADGSSDQPVTLSEDSDAAVVVHHDAVGGDDTAAIRAAIVRAVREGQRWVALPDPYYRITDTLWINDDRYADASTDRQVLLSEAGTPQGGGLWGFVFSGGAGTRIESTVHPAMVVGNSLVSNADQSAQRQQDILSSVVTLRDFTLEGGGLELWSLQRHSLISSVAVRDVLRSGVSPQVDARLSPNSPNRSDSPVRPCAVFVRYCLTLELRDLVIDRPGAGRTSAVDGLHLGNSNCLCLRGLAAPAVIEGHAHGILVSDQPRVNGVTVNDTPNLWVANVALRANTLCALRLDTASAGVIEGCSFGAANDPAAGNGSAGSLYTVRIGTSQAEGIRSLQLCDNHFYGRSDIASRGIGLDGSAMTTLLANTFDPRFTNGGDRRLYRTNAAADLKTDILPVNLVASL